MPKDDLLFPCSGQLTTARVTRDLIVLSSTEALIEEADLAVKSPARRNAMIRRAFELDPGCIHAHRLAARLADNPAVRVHHLAQAVLSGQELWDPVIEELGHVDPTTNRGIYPYLGALWDLGEALTETRDVEGARVAYEELLRFMPWHGTVPSRLVMLEAIEADGMFHEAPTRKM